MKRMRYTIQLLLVVVMLVLAGCSTTKYVPDGSYLLEKVKVESDDPSLDAATMQQYIRMKGNSKWFSVFKIPLGTYSLAGRDTTKWLNRTLRNVGEEPVVYDTLKALQTQEDLNNAMRSMGYMHSSVSQNNKVKGKKLTVVYTLHPGEPYYISSMSYDIQDSAVAAVLNMSDTTKWGLHAGSRFVVNELDGERKRITKILNDNGFYRFHKDFILYTADSLRGSNKVNLTLHLLKYRPTGSSPEMPHPRYVIDSVRFVSADSSKVNIRQSVLESNTLIESGKYFSSTDLQKTYNNFGRLGAVRYTNIRFDERPEDEKLNTTIMLSPNKVNTISFQPEGTNTSGDLGAALSLTYQNRNIFRGSELLSVQFRAAYEAITGLEGYENQDYIEYNVETRLQFPHFAAPFLSREFKRHSQSTSELSVSYNVQNRPEFHRMVFSAGWRYRWSIPSRNIAYSYDVLDLNYVYMPWISPTFKADYLDNATSRNAILRYNYEDLFIMRMGLGLSWNNGSYALKGNVETAGNLLNLSTAILGGKRNEEGQHTLFNIAYAQYAKADIDFTKVVDFDKHNSLAMHCGLGIAYPYGNSDMLPFEKRYFSGGANSVRGWSVRGLGPGKFKGTDGRIDFINQTGDMKLDLNMEFRTFLFWKFNGAIFVDAGNIWTLRNYEDQPGGKFEFKDFYKEIAVAYGVGLRLNFDYFIIRTDMGMKAINPAYDNSHEHYAIVHPKWGRDFAFHFAVGMPF